SADVVEELRQLMEGAAQLELHGDAGVGLLVKLRPGLDEARRQAAQLGDAVQVLEEGGDLRLLREDPLVGAIDGLTERQLGGALDVALLPLLCLHELLVELYLLRARVLEGLG